MIISREKLLKLKQIYLDSFPVEERRKWNEIERPLKAYGPKILVINNDSDEAVGLLTYWLFESFVYIEHFAIEPGSRGGGLGSSTLVKFLDLQSKPVVLEIECPEISDEAKHRFDFYKRLGFYVISKDYIQPPYYPGLNSVPMWLLSDSDGLDPGSVENVLCTEVYGNFLV